MQPELWAEIKRLRAVEKLSISEIARRARKDRKTVRQTLESQSMPIRKPRNPKPSKLIPFKGYLQERLEQYPRLSGTSLFEEIKKQGYTGKLRLLNKYLLTRRSKAKEVFLRIETSAGEQGQVDWANCGTLTIGHAIRKLSCFVMVLSYSRMMYLEFTLSQCLEDFIQCHANAFRFLGGIPKKILYDNLKTVVLSRIGAQIHWNAKFMEFSGIFGFEPILCNVARGNEKGKVEKNIDYIRRNLLEGKTIQWPEIQQEGQLWLTNVANVRLHRTTRERPIDRWEKEKPCLLPLPQLQYDSSILRHVRSSHQALVRFDGNIYSVPAQYAYKTLVLRSDKQTVRISLEGQEIARHPRSYDRGSVIEDPKHFEGVLATKKKAMADRLTQSFLELGPDAQLYLEGLITSSARANNHISKIMELVATYGKEEVLASISYALEFKAFGAAYIQNILEQKRQAKGLGEVLPIVIPQKPSWNEIITEEPDLSVYDRLLEDPL